jgi:hypothetical protein
LNCRWTQRSIKGCIKSLVAVPACRLADTKKSFEAGNYA